MESFLEAWDLICDYCKKQVTDVSYETWFSKLVPISLDFGAGVAIIQAPNEFNKSTIERGFHKCLNDAVQSVFGEAFTYKLITPMEKKEKERVPDDDEYEYTFETFIEGSSNKFACAACRYVAKEPAKNYNPLFIYGNSGLGKTHLLLAIGQTIRHNNPSAKIAYVKGEEFVNQMVKSIGTGTAENFRQKYRNADLLLMDDIQFIAGKDSTQEEFFHTFNCLYEAGKQIVVTSDRPPKEMKRLDDRLCTRLEGGLLADFQPPDLETRTAIIRTKAAQFGMILSEDVVQYIAENITSNVRQLEGVVKRLTAYRDILDDTITVDSVKRAIRDVIRTGTYIPTPDVIIEESARSFQLTGADLRGQSRSKKTAMARQIAMYLMRNLTNLPLKEIGEEFGGRNHATVLSSIRKVEELLKSDPEIAATVRDITSNINSKN